MSTLRTLGRVAVLLVIVAAATVAAWALFVEYPTDLAEVLGVVLVIGTALAALRFGGDAARSLLPDYNVAEVAVEGPISREAGGVLPGAAVGTPADDVVDEIERADDDDSVDALLLKLNTPGGEIVPSEDIRIAAERFDGPTVGYATDVCASGGYDIASGCDELWAREGSIVGSIGVVGSRVNVHDLADRLGVRYEQFTAGEYKDAGVPLKDLEDDERAYLQGIVDDYYEQFVESVVEGRDVDRETVEETEARVYLGTEAHDLGLVDELGTREDVIGRLEDRLEAPVTVEEFELRHGLTQRLRGGAQAVVFALGVGLASAIHGDSGVGGSRFRR